LDRTFLETDSVTEPLDLSVFPAATWEDWRATVEEELSSRTLDGLEIQALYGPAPPAPAEFPGQPPFTRGSFSEARWGMVQEYANPDPEATVEELEEDLRREAAGAWLRFDEPLRNGVPLRTLEPETARERLLRGGLGVSSGSDLRRILEVLDLRRSKIFLDAGRGSHAAAAALIEGAVALGVSFAELEGCLGCDPFADATRGARLPAGEPFADLAELAVWCSREAPELRAALVSTSAYHDAGASPVQELAFAAAAGTEILRRLTAAALSVEEACRQILFAFSVTGDLFAEIAKLRAARRVWWRIASACGSSAAVGRMVIHARTSRRTSTALDRGVNALRGTVETFAAAAGGADTVATAPFDEALGTPGAFGRKVAANTQLILRHESFLGRVTDPAGGSWYVEEHTNQLAEAAWSLFQQIEAEGGFAEALRCGGIRRRLEETAGQRRQLLATRRSQITGVSEFPNLQ
jgi:methylmalonyl-CoA mutase